MRTEPRAQAYAAAALRLLLEGVLPADVLDCGEAFLQLAHGNAIFVRVAEACAALQVSVPDRFAAAVARERRRVAATLAVVRTVSEACRRRGIGFVFPKALQHYPDMGTDVDLVVLSSSADRDHELLAGLTAMSRHATVRDRVAGVRRYAIAGCDTPLDIAHGRLGNFGEHARFAAELVRRARPRVIEGFEFRTPDPEHQLVLQGIQRVYGRLSFRLADVLYTIVAARDDRLNWDSVLHDARQTGVLAGLGCYLGYVDQIHDRAFGRRLLPGRLRRVLGADRWGRVEFRDRAYRFPSVRVSACLYARQFGALVAQGEWRAAARLTLLPLVGVAAGAPKLLRGEA